MEEILGFISIENELRKQNPGKLSLGKMPIHAPK